jgi:hypothetical protein
LAQGERGEKRRGEERKGTKRLAVRSGTPGSSHSPSASPLLTPLSLSPLFCARVTPPRAPQELAPTTDRRPRSSYAGAAVMAAPSAGAGGGGGEGSSSSAAAAAAATIETHGVHEGEHDPPRPPA